MKAKYLLLLMLVFFCFVNLVNAQDDEEKDKKKDRHEFTMVKELKTTPVKSQAKTGTCWCFATTSFIETELLRMGKGEYDLSEMFIIHNTYPIKATKYMRYMGMGNFGPGGQAHDVFHIMDKFGAMPEEVYSGIMPGDKEHNHAELENMLDGILKSALKRTGTKTTTNWKDIIDFTLNKYLGEIPNEFEYKGKKYTPKSFADELGIKSSDYIELTSFSHHPFYKTFVLEIPDNWTDDEYYNVPIDDIVKVMDYAIDKGYSIAWDGDVGKENFYSKPSYAVVPVTAEDDQTKEEKKLPEKEKQITQADRQDAFDTYTTTDDHLMHITGVAKDQEGTKFYYTKNSWGTKDRKYDGFWYMSEPFIRLRTVAIMVHKDAIPQEIKTKLGL